MLKKRADTAASADAHNGFECVRCGACCRAHGYVAVGIREIEEIADYLGLSAGEMSRQFACVAEVGGRQVLILRDYPGTTRCVFLDEGNLCRIHPVKPQQCRDFPALWSRVGADLFCQGLLRLREPGISEALGQ